MPFPNEHSVRIKSPTKYKKFRRVNNKFGKGKDAIFGITKSGKAELQAVRFDKHKHNIEAVKAWAKEHPHISVTPASDHMSATDVSVRGSLQNVSIMPRQTDPQEIPSEDDIHTLESKEQKDLSGITYGNQEPIQIPPAAYGMQRMYPSAYGTRFVEAGSHSKVLFVRHGSTSLNSENLIRGWSDPPLSAEGRHEVVKTAKKLSTKPIKQIYTSDLIRSQETAQAISNSTSAPIIASKDLRPWNLGDFTGQNSDEVLTKIQPYLDDMDLQVPGGESLNTFKNRFMGYYNMITDNNYGDPIVVVAHHRNDKLLESMVGDSLNADEFLKPGIEPGAYREISTEPYEDSDVDDEELQLGSEHELEHTTNPEEAKQIALDHLKKIPDYYTRLNIMEQTAEAEHPSTGEAISHTEYAVDVGLGIKDMDQLSKDKSVTQIPANIKADLTGQLQKEAEVEGRDKDVYTDSGSSEIYNEGAVMDDNELKEGSWVEAFRVGTHTDAEGISRKWEPKDVETIAQQYNQATSETNPNRHIAPVCVGHPKDNSPAFGWVEKAKAVGGKLMLKLGQLQPEFVDALKRGLYKTRSISLYPDLNIRHIGFLGASVPAIKGLEPFKFNEGDKAITYEFAEGSFEDVNEMKRELGFFRKLFDSFKMDINTFFNHTEGTSKDLQTAEVKTQGTSDVRQEGATMSETTPSAVVGQSGTGLTAETPTVPNIKDESEKTIQGAPAPQTKAVPVMEIKDDKDELTTLRAENTKLKDALQKAENEAKRLQQVVDDDQKADALKSFREFAETLVTEGRLLPRDVEQTALNIRLRDDMDKKTAQDFVEKKTDKVTNYVEEYKAYLGTLPTVVEFDEFATKTTAQAKSEVPGAKVDECDYVEKKIKEFMEKDKNLSYADAFTKLSSEEPEAVQKHLFDSSVPIVSGNI